MRVNDHPFEVPEHADNAQAVVRVEWNTPGSDRDMRVYRDTDGDGVVDAGEPRVGASQTGTTDFEQTTPGPAGARAGQVHRAHEQLCRERAPQRLSDLQVQAPFQAAQVERAGR